MQKIACRLALVFVVALSVLPAEAASRLIFPRILLQQGRFSGIRYGQRRCLRSGDYLACL